MFISKINLQRKAQPFLEKNVDEKRKAISPLIATILLVVVAVAIIGIVLSWGKGFANTSLSSADNINTKDSFTGLVWSFQTTGNNVLVENKSKQDLNITGYTINSLDHNGFWINSYHPLETNLSISPGTSNNVPLICMPEGKFILTLKTSTNENIPLNISPSKTLLGGTCEEYNVSLWEFVSGTGSYSINTFTMQEGDRLSNWDFTNWNTVNVVVNDNNTFTSGAGGVFKSGATQIGKRYSLYIAGDSNVSKLVIRNASTSIIYNEIINTANFNEHLEFNSVATNFWLYNLDYGITNISSLYLTEIPPLETITIGTKYLENTTAGTTAIQSKQAYGEWEFDVYKGTDSSTLIIPFISNTNTLNTDGYGLLLNNTENIFFRSYLNGTPFNFWSTTTSYLSTNTWYRLKVARLQSEGVFKDIPTLQTSFVNETYYPYDSFTINNINSFNAANDGSQLGKITCGPTLNITLGNKYFVEFDLKLNEGIFPRLSMSSQINGTNISNSVLSVEGKNSIVLTVTSTDIGRVTFRNLAGDVTDYEVSNLIIRRIYPANTFAVFIKGGSFGDDNWTLISTTGGSGTNPVTDSTYTTSNYFVADLDAGDRIANIKIKPNID